MPEIDYVVREIKLNYSGVINLKELYDLIRSWFNERGFFVVEKESEGSESEEGESYSTKFEVSKKVEEYTKYFIKVVIKSESIKETSQKHVYKGGFSVTVESWLQKDYEERYENKPIIKFFKSLNEKFIEKSRFNKYENELRDYTNSIFNEVKAFLNLSKV